MGNKNSSGVVSNSSQQQEDISAAAQNGEHKSGVFLAEDLQNEIIQSFQSKILQQQWEKRQYEILASSNKRVAAEEEQRQEFEKRLSRWREQHDQVHQTLDQDIDALRARFADAEVGVRWDVGKLEGKVGASPKFGDGSACINLRADLASCYKDADDIRKCDGFVEALERCAKQAVLSS